MSSFADTYLHPDWQGSARVATGTGGAVAWREHYDPYGKRLTNAGVEKRGFTGHSYDAETGNTYMLARYYDGEVGLFLRPDPVGSADDFVLYAYVHGNPTNATDPTGMVHEYAQPRGLGGGFGMGLEGSDLINAGDGASNAPETDPTANAQQDTGTTNTEPTMLASAVGTAGVLSNVSALGRGVAAGAVEAATIAVDAALALKGDTPTQYVIRGGIANAKNLQDGSVRPLDPPFQNITGFSVTTAPGMSIEQLAIARSYPNNKISYTTIEELASVGSHVALTPYPDRGNPLHATVVGPQNLSIERANQISSVFHVMDNPSIGR